MEIALSVTALLTMVAYWKVKVIGKAAIYRWIESEARCRAVACESYDYAMWVQKKREREAIAEGAR